MIDVKRAIEIAGEKAMDVIPAANADIRLEEIERGQDERPSPRPSTQVYDAWSITLSFRHPDSIAAMAARRE